MDVKEIMLNERNLISKDFTVSFYLYNSFKMKKFQKWKPDQLLPGLRNKEIAEKEMGVAIKIPCDDGIVLDFDCGSEYTNLHI